MQVDTAVTCLTTTMDPALDVIRRHIDKDYEACLTDVLEGTRFSELQKQLSKVFDRLSIEGEFIMLDGSRIVVPRTSVREVLQRLHVGHPGQDKSLKLAQALFYWPGMTNDVRQFVETCKVCFRRLPSQRSNPCITDPPSSSYGPPMAKVGLDLFECNGGTYLICVDRWSGFPLYHRLRAQTVQAVINILETWFNVMGWPASIRSDGGPQFTGQFSAWCRDKKISHELSSPYNPKSNGLAESAVKNIKYLMQKCAVSGENVGRAVYEWRNVPRTDGYSPAQLLFGRRQFTSVPAGRDHYLMYDVLDAQNKNSHSRSQNRFLGRVRACSAEERRRIIVRSRYWRKTIIEVKENVTHSWGSFSSGPSLFSSIFSSVSKFFCCCSGGVPKFFRIYQKL